LAKSLRTARRVSPALFVVLLLLAVWGGRFIWDTTVDVSGRRFFCLFDDAMISMAYARNLVEGHGLNWARQGAPVEGFTHPLWTFLMIPVNASGLPLGLRSLPIQLFSLACLLLNAVLVYRLVGRHFSFGDAGGIRSGLPAALLTAFYYPLNYWALFGMETGLQAVLVTASVLLALDIVLEGRDRHLPLFLLGAAAYLLRMDMLLMVGVVQLFVLFFSFQGGRRPGPAERRHWLLGAALFAAAALGYSAFRGLYFHDLLPNTYYLKLTGVPLDVRVLRGAACLKDTLVAHLGVLLPVAAGTAYVLARGEGGERARWGRWRRWLLPAALFLIYCAYSAWVGGDAWEKDGGVMANRFLAFVFPLVFVLGNGLLNRGLDGLDGLDGRQPGLSTGALPRAILAVALTAITAIAFLAANSVWPFAPSGERWRDLVLDRPPVLVAGHQWVFNQTRLLERIALPGAVVATVWAGIPAYLTDWKMVDILGYNDVVIARESSTAFLNRKNYRQFQPGHVKWDYEHVLEVHQPDAFLQLWATDLGMERRLLRPRGYRRINGFWVQTGLSPNRINYAASAPVR
jgi:hypothetical protein